MKQITLVSNNKYSVLSKSIVLGAIALMVIDVVYSNIAGINMTNRQTECLVYRLMPRWLFLIYEYMIETALIVLLGVFVGVLAERYLGKVQKFFPRNQVLAFAFAALLPVCSCGVIPLIETMKKKVSLRVIVTFVISAPLLNPYIIILSYSVLGFTYGTLRIISAFILALVTGFVVDLIAKKYMSEELGVFHSCNKGCSVKSSDPFVATLKTTRKLLPYIIVGGLLGLGLELFDPKHHLTLLSFSDQWISKLIMLIVGVPLYVCNGADVLLLHPLLQYTDLSSGAAIVFSLASTGMCISSIVMLSAFIGRKMTSVLVVCVAIMSYLLGTIIDFVIF